MKLPVPFPAEAWLSVKLALPEVFQQTPLSVIVYPHGEVIEPPQTAESVDMAVTAAVAAFGRQTMAESMEAMSFKLSRAPSKLSA